MKGAAHFYKDKGRHLVTVRTEHKATLDTMRELEREGFEVTYLDVRPNGLLDLEQVKAVLRKRWPLAQSSFFGVTFFFFGSSSLMRSFP